MDHQIELERWQEGGDFSHAILDALATHIAVLDCHGTIVVINEPWRRFARENSTESGQPARRTEVGSNYLDICRESVGPASEGAMAAHDGIQAVLAGQFPSFTLEYPCHSPTEQRWFLMVVTPLGTPRREVVISHVNITERKKAEQALRESEQKHRLLLEHSGVGVGYYSMDGKILLFNQEAGKRLEGKPEDFLGKSILDVFERPAADEYLRRIQVAAASEGSQEYEDFVHLPSGDKWFLSDYARVVNSVEVIGVQIVARDITERKRADKTLLASESKYRRLYESMRDAFVCVDMNGRILEFNRAYQEMLGYEPDELIALTYKDLTPQKWHAMEAEIVQEQILLKSYSDIYEKEYQRKDGTVLSVELRTLLLRDAAGVPCGMWAIVRDITERKRIELEILATHQRLETLMRAVPVGVSFSDDPTCQHITGNPVALAQFEVTHKDNLSASAPDDVAPGRQICYFAQGQQLCDTELPLQRAVAENQEIGPLELEVELPSGRRWFTQASGAPLCDTQGNVVGGVAVTVDITERKRAEEQIRSQLEELQRWHDVMLGREDRVQELKREVNDLCRRAGEVARYPSQEADSADSAVARPRS